MTPAPSSSKERRRLWVVPLVAVLAGTGAWYSAARRASAAPQPVDFSSGRPKLLEFGMGLCDQCKRLAPVMEQASRELGAQVEVHVLDIRNDENEQLGGRFGMVAIPLVVLTDPAGNELWRHEGFIDFAALSRAVSSHLPRPTPAR